eukprot:TRINITY_DN10805_c0_g2_i1.p1 TRINITY_DN10805_c0_g2~~TRINITY_DN10805_c0_g2_i1.p1  ORF type:complete len:133 (-),score=4.08 TRINITY_DN10805_c0_g2_i1:223-621(-)
MRLAAPRHEVAGGRWAKRWSCLVIGIDQLRAAEPAVVTVVSPTTRSDRLPTAMQAPRCPMAAAAKVRCPPAAPLGLLALGLPTLGLLALGGLARIAGLVPQRLLVITSGVIHGLALVTGASLLRLAGFLLLT